MRRPERHERRAAEHKARKALWKAQRNHLKAIRWCDPVVTPNGNICPSLWDLPRAYRQGEIRDHRLERFKERHRMRRRGSGFGWMALTQALAVATMGGRSI